MTGITTRKKARRGNSYSAILYVDDETSARRAFHRALRGSPYLTVGAENGDEALLLVRQIHFDAAVLDLRMPGMNGFELFRALRRIEPAKIPLYRSKACDRIPFAHSLLLTSEANDSPQATQVLP